MKLKMTRNLTTTTTTMIAYQIHEKTAPVLFNHLEDSHSKYGVILNTKGRKKRKDYPSSWARPSSQMEMKKRVLCVFDGPRRLWKEDMMLDTEYEVRMKLSDEKAYVTDLDVQAMRRAESFHNSKEMDLQNGSSCLVSLQETF